MVTKLMPLASEALGYIAYRSLFLIFFPILSISFEYYVLLIDHLQYPELLHMGVR